MVEEQNFKPGMVTLTTTEYERLIDRAATSEVNYVQELQKKQKWKNRATKLLNFIRQSGVLTEKGSADKYRELMEEEDWGVLA